MRTETVTAIANYIKENRETSFEWGTFDCCVVISKIIEINTGLLLYENYRGHYTSELGAKRALVKYGSIESTLDEHFKRIKPEEIQRGDVAMMDDDVMAFSFSGRMLATAAIGIIQVDTKIKLAWRVESCQQQ